jgi:hypothetical protein
MVPVYLLTNMGQNVNVLLKSILGELCMSFDAIVKGSILRY